MIFLENLLQDKPKVGITNLLSNITTKPDSHKGGWARLLKCQLKNMYIDATILTNADSLADFDVIIFDLGAEFSGSLNMFGGLDEKVFKRLQQIEAYQGRLFSWKHQLPSVDSLEGRRSNASTCEAFKQTDTGFLGRVQEKLNQARRFDHAYKTNSLLLGDSHTPGVWDPSFMIERRDGRTLTGMLNSDSIGKYLRVYKEANVQIDDIQIHASSIDIRHHICRLPLIEELAKRLAWDLINFFNKISDLKVTFTHTMGIEDESRELPKTGYYKGTPFYGSWEDRNKARLIFNSELDKVKEIDYDFKVQSYPEYFFDKSGKLRFDVMERPQSVHISPAHYKWDLDENKLRWTYEHEVKMKTHFTIKKISADLEEDLYGS